MVRDRIYEYFIEEDNNCVEVMPRALNDEYCLGMPDDSVKLVSGFGGGTGCGKAYGVPCGGCSAISYRLVHEGAHVTPGLKPAATAFAEEFVERFGLDACCELAKTYKEEDTRCLDMIYMAADIADACFGRIISEGRGQSK